VQGRWPTWRPSFEIRAPGGRLAAGPPRSTRGRLTYTGAPHTQSPAYIPECSGGPLPRCCSRSCTDASGEVHDLHSELGLAPPLTTTSKAFRRADLPTRAQLRRAAARSLQRQAPKRRPAPVSAQACLCCRPLSMARPRRMRVLSSTGLVPAGCPVHRLCSGKEARMR